MSRSRSAIWNYASALLFTVVTLVGLVTTRFVLRWLGESRYGAFRMLTDWLGYLNVLELGLTGALSPLLAKALADQDKPRSRATLAVGLQAFLRIGLLAVGLGLFMWLIVDWLIPVEVADLVDLRIAWGISLLTLLPMMLAPFRALADAGQRGYRVNLALTVQSLLIFGLSVLFARIGLGISGQALATTLATLPLILMLTYEGYRHDPDLIHSALRESRDPSIHQALIQLAIPTFFISLCGRISLLTDSLVVGNILGPSLAARLVLTQKLAVMAQGQLQSIGTASWAAMAELHARGKREDFNKRLIELTGLVAILAVSALGPIIAYNHHFISLWVGPERDAGLGVVVVSAVNALLLGLFSLWFWCFSGTGQVRRMLPITILAATINLTASIVLTKIYGIIGPLLGSTLSFITINLWVLPLELKRSFDTSIFSLSTAWLYPLGLGVPYAAALWWLARIHTPWGWVGLAIEMGGAALGALLINAMAVMTAEQRATWTARILGAVPRGWRRRPVEVAPEADA